MKKTLIELKNISKRFTEDYVIKDFSYSFDESGLYVLFGESGCGKTTLLNILYGALSIDSGKIIVGKDTYNDIMPETITKKHIAYITQKNYFVDYLNIYDNLLLAIDKNVDVSIIDTYLEKFNLSYLKNKYPSALSGGEKNRIALIRALLNNYKIILIDEVTAALDEENRNLVLDMLKELKKTHLIIFATHDKKVKSIADATLTFPLVSNISSSPMTELEPTTRKKRFVLPFMLKKYTYKKRERKSTIYLLIFLVVALLCIFYSSNPERKVEVSLLKYNNVNFVGFYCNLNTNDYCDYLLREYDIADKVYSYRLNYDLDIESNNIIDTLPFEETLFPLKDKIIYGTYFNESTDIILGYNIANMLSEDISSLIGQTYTLSLPDGNIKFNIAGILDNLEDNLYMNALSGLEYNNTIYINSLYAKKYMEDDKLGSSEKSFYNGTYLRAYFNDANDLYAFLDKYEGYAFKNGSFSPNYDITAESYAYNFPEFVLSIKNIEAYMLPILITVFIITMLFYFQIDNIKNYYQKHILGIYNYLAYKWSNILLANIISTLLYLSSIFILSFIISIILSNIINYIYMIINPKSYILFLVDYKLSLILLIALIILGSLLSLINTLFLKKKGWLYVVSSGDDLL